MHVVITVRDIFFFKVHGVKKVCERVTMRQSAPRPFFPRRISRSFSLLEQGNQSFLRRPNCRDSVEMQENKLTEDSN